MHIFIDAMQCLQKYDFDMIRWEDIEQCTKVSNAYSEISSTSIHIPSLLQLSGPL